MKKDKEGIIDNELPISFAMTEIHILFLYPSNLTIVSRITKEIVFSKSFEGLYLKGI